MEFYIILARTRDLDTSIRVEMVIVSEVSILTPYWRPCRDQKTPWHGIGESLKSSNFPQDIS
jgi:hypothetical protein